jgi:hypothetical protein
MAISINDNLGVQANKPLDDRYGPYTGADEAAAILAANNAVPSARRFRGLVVGLNINGVISEYWYKDGVANENLVVKQTDLSEIEAELDFALQNVVAKAPLTPAFDLTGAFDVELNETYVFSGQFVNSRPEYTALVGGGRLFYNSSSERWELQDSDNSVRYWHPFDSYDPALLQSITWRRVTGESSVAHTLTLSRRNTPSEVASVNGETGVVILTPADIGAASLVEGKVPASQLPSYVDDIIEIPSLADIQLQGWGAIAYQSFPSSNGSSWGVGSSANVYQLVDPQITPLIAVGAYVRIIFPPGVDLWMEGQVVFVAPAVPPNRTAVTITIQRTSHPNFSNGGLNLLNWSLVPATTYYDESNPNHIAPPASGKIYTALDSNKIYRWGGTQFTEVSPNVIPSISQISGLQAALDSKASGNELNLKAPLYNQVTLSGASPSFLNGSLNFVSVSIAKRPQYEGSRTSGEIIRIVDFDDVYLIQSELNGVVTNHALAADVDVSSPLVVTYWKVWDTENDPFSVTITGQIQGVPSAATIAGTALGTAAAGTSASYARADHVHPLPGGLSNLTIAHLANLPSGDAGTLNTETFNFIIAKQDASVTRLKLPYVSSLEAGNNVGDRVIVSWNKHTAGGNLNGKIIFQRLFDGFYDDFCEMFAGEYIVFESVKSSLNDNRFWEITSRGTLESGSRSESETEGFAIAMALAL